MNGKSGGVEEKESVDGLGREGLILVLVNGMN